MTDLQLLQQHATHRDPGAFNELVTRHLNWVYSAALRQVQDAHLADDVTQAVFLALSQSAAKLAKGVVLTAWLFRVTQRTSAMAIRSQGRRRKHERRAAIMSSEQQPEMDQQTWEELAPVLDELVGKLNETDRQSILLRYYQQKSFAEISTTLDIDEAAARKRTSRAVEKLRTLLQNKGVTTTSALLVAGLSTYTTQPAPASTAAGIAAVVATPAAASATVLTLTQGALNIMKWSNLKIGSIAAILTLAAIGISLAVAQVSGGNNQQAAANPAKPATAPAAKPPVTKPAAPLTPKGVVEAAYIAALTGDEETMIKSFANPTADQEQTLRKVVRTMSAVEELRKAVASEFGENIAKQFGALGSGVSATDITNAPETINGAQAIVDLGQAGPGPLPLVKTGDTWKVSPTALQTMNVDGLNQWERKAPAIRKLAADIKAGKFQSPAELQKAMGGLMRQ